MIFSRRSRIERKLRHFIVDQLLDEPYGGRDPLEGGAVDSLSLEQLVQYIEEEFGVRLTDEQMIKQNFSSLPALASFVDSRLRGVSS